MHNKRSLVTGYIVGVQEQRFRIMTDSGQGLLLTLSYNSSISSNKLNYWYETHSHVMVEYEGEPNYVSGVVYNINPSKKRR